MRFLLFPLIFSLTTCSIYTNDSNNIPSSDHGIMHSGTVYSTGGRTETTISGTGEEDSQALISLQKDPRMLSVKEYQEIAQKLLLKKLQSDQKKNTHSFSLVQGDWQAVYTPPEYPDKYDSIVVTMSGKTYIFPGVYGSSERTKYLVQIQEAKKDPNSSCNLVGNDPEKILIDGKYYLPPTTGDCLAFPTFGSFFEFSPSGYYLVYHEFGYESSSVKMIDISTGENILSNDFAYIDMITWTPDRKQMFFLGSPPNDERGGLYLTRLGDFPHVDEIDIGKSSGFDMQSIYSLGIDEKYIYILTGEVPKITEGAMDYGLRIFDKTTLKEIYTTNVKL